MTDDLTTLPEIGPTIAAACREAGYETADDIREAAPEELTEITGIGTHKAETILAGETVERNAGRPSKFSECREDVLEAADGPLNIRQVAQRGGTVKSTLYQWFDKHPEFEQEFRRVRSEAADRLIARGLDPDDEIDMQFVRFLLERSFQFIKTERHEVEADNTHKIEGDGFVVEFNE